MESKSTGKAIFIGLEVDSYYYNYNRAKENNIVRFKSGSEFLIYVGNGIGALTSIDVN